MSDYLYTHRWTVGHLAHSTRFPLVERVHNDVFQVLHVFGDMEINSEVGDQHVGGCRRRPSANPFLGTNSALWGPGFVPALLGITVCLHIIGNLEIMHD